MSEFQQAESLARSGKKIHAIKEFRARTGAGLKDAKEAVEHFQAHGTWPARYLTPSAPEPAAPADGDPRLRDLEQLIARGKVIHAIKELRTLTRWGLKESKEAVDHYRGKKGWPARLLDVLELSAPEPGPSPSTSSEPTPGSPRAELERLMAKSRKIQAVKLMREVSGWGLREAKDAVDHYQHHRTWTPGVLAIIDGGTGGSATSGGSAGPTTAADTSAVVDAIARSLGYAPQVRFITVAQRAPHHGHLVLLDDRAYFVRSDDGQWVFDPIISYRAVTHAEVERGSPATLYVSQGQLHERFMLERSQADEALAIFRVFAG